MFGHFLHYEMNLTFEKVVRLTQAACKKYDKNLDRYCSKVLLYNPYRKNEVVSQTLKEWRHPLDPRRKDDNRQRAQKWFTGEKWHSFLRRDLRQSWWAQGDCNVGAHDRAGYAVARNRNRRRRTRRRRTRHRRRAPLYPPHRRPWPQPRLSHAH